MEKSSPHKKVRTTLLIDEEVDVLIEALCTKSSFNKTEFINEALRTALAQHTPKLESAVLDLQKALSNLKTSRK